MSAGNSNYLNDQFIQARYWLADVIFFENDILFYLAIIKRNIILSPERKLLLELEVLRRKLKKLHAQNSVFYISIFNQIAQIELNEDVEA